VPVFWLCIRLAASHIEHAANPVILHYVYDLFALAFLMLSMYYVAAFTFRQAKVRRLMFSTSMAAYFTIVTLADGGALYQAGVLTSLALYGLICQLILTKNLGNPPWAELEEISAEDEDIYGA